MVELAIKVLAVIGGIACAVASYPYLNQYVLALLALFGAIAVGIIAGAIIYAVLNWVLASINNRP